MCSVGSELSSYASSVENQNFYGIGLSWISRTKGDLVVELSLSSSFDLTNSFWTLSMHRFISRNCRHRIGGCPYEVGVPVALSGRFVVGVLVTALAEGCGG
ncbi:hypothetical protein BHM03_00008411 [Ensete ventricosum]|nr:hypothetical protein BHM03_00008411 [Ensete ventricosum]